MSEDKLAIIQTEIVRLKQCYESATGKPVCGEGSVIRMECQQMTTMRTQLDRQYKLLQRAVEVVEIIFKGELYIVEDSNRNYTFTSIRIDDENLLILSKLQALLSDLEEALKEK